MAFLANSEHNVTNFGLFSKVKMEQVSVLLDSLDVRYYFDEETATEARLREWEAWDESAAEPHKAYNLWTHFDDYEKVGTHIVEMFPERKFGAK